MASTTLTALDLNILAEEERLAFIGALFAISAADQRMEDIESRLIFESLDLDGLSEEGRRQAFEFAVQPPPLALCLERFKDADEALRHSLMLNLIDIVIADDAIEMDEHIGLRLAQRMLRIPDDRVEAMHDLVFQAQHPEEPAADQGPRRPFRFVP